MKVHMIDIEKKKLTIRIDARVIDQAKVYASLHSVSVSQLVEAYLQDLAFNNETSKHSPLVRELTGIIPNDIDVEAEYHTYLIEKYGP